MITLFTQRRPCSFVSRRSEEKKMDRWKLAIVIYLIQCFRSTRLFVLVCCCLFTAAVYRNWIWLSTPFVNRQKVTSHNHIWVLFSGHCWVGLATQCTYYANESRVRSANMYQSRHTNERRTDNGHSIWEFMHVFLDFFLFAFGLDRTPGIEWRPQNEKSSVRNHSIYINKYISADDVLISERISRTWNMICKNA